MLLRKCKNCGRYTCKIFCPVCGKKTEKAAPPKYYRKHIKYLIQKIDYETRGNSI